MSNPFAATAAWSARHPAITIAAVLALTISLGAGLANAEPGRINELFAPDDLPSLSTQRTIEETWGQSEGAFLLYITEDPTDPDLLRAIHADMQRAQELDDVQDVVGLPGILAGQLGDLDNDAKVRAAAQAMAPELENLVSADAILVRIAMDPVQDVQATAADLAAIRDASTAPDVRAAGPVFLEAVQNEEAGGDVGILMPLSLTTVIVLLLFLFRRVQDVAVPLLTTLLSIAMAYGTVAWVGLPLAPPSFIVMPLLLGLGIDYMLHIVYAYREQDAGPVAARFRLAGQEVGYPVFFTAATTLIGFGSFLASNVPQIRTWGLLIGSGALYAFILGFTMMPALYRIRRKKNRATRLPLGNAMDHVTRAVLGNRAAVLVIVGCATLGLGLAAAFVDIEDSVAFDMDENLPPVQDLNAVQERFGGQSIAQFLITPGDQEALAEFEGALKASPFTGFLDGPTQRLERNPNAPLVGPATEGVATAAYWRVIVGYDDAETSAAFAAFAAIADASPLDARMTGPEVLRQESESVFLENLLRSTIVALTLVVALLVAVFRRPIAALLAFLPLAVTVVWQVGIQSIIGIPINPITGVMTAMIMGVGVDYSLHIMASTQEKRRAGVPSKDAAAAAMRSVGRPVLAATITTVLAFSVLGFSSLLPLRHFGIVAAIVVACAFVVSLTLLPVLASFLPNTKPAATPIPSKQPRKQPRRVLPGRVQPRFADPAVRAWHEQTQSVTR